MLLLLSNSRSLDLELTLFYPCHKKNNNKNKNKNKNNPSPKSIRRGCTGRLKFDAQTIHRLLAEFRGLGVHVTRTTGRTKPRAKVLLKLEFDAEDQVLSLLLSDFP